MSALTTTDSQLKEGYKQTEIGIIPNDWSIVTLGEVLSFQNGVNADKKAYGTGIPFINISEVIANSFLTVDKIPGRVSLSSQITKSFKVEFGDVLFNRTSETLEEVGLASIYLDNADVVFGGFVIRGKPNKDHLDPIFCSYLLRSPNIHSQISSKGQGVVRANIGQKELSKVKIFIPSKSEQEAIAHALSDIDALIESLDRLLTKKCQIKQGAMQELLRSKDSWLNNRLGDIATFINGRAYSIHEWETSGTPVIRLQNLTGRGEDYYYSNLVLPDKQYCDKGDLLFMWSATFGPIIWNGSKAIYHYHIWKVECHQHKLHKDFFYHLLADMTEKLKNKSSSGGTMLHLTKIGMDNMLIKVPPFKEQIAIATILSDMDAEIDSIEAKLTKTRQIKQGMMHELLTGRIRLV
jgi:type I restriction enzyme, S subunit